LLHVLRTSSTFSDNCVGDMPTFIVDRICKNQNVENDLLEMKKRRTFEERNYLYFRYSTSILSVILYRDPLNFQMPVK